MKRVSELEGTCLQYCDMRSQTIRWLLGTHNRYPVHFTLQTA